MRIAALTLLLTSACAPVVNVSSAVLSGIIVYRQAMNPPEKIYPVSKRGIRFSSLVYEDDPRIAMWCADEKQRKKIEVYCSTRPEEDR